MAILIDMNMFFSRTFVSTSQEQDSLIVHWLHAINPGLFTKQIIR